MARRRWIWVVTGLFWLSVSLAVPPIGAAVQPPEAEPAAVSPEEQAVLQELFKLGRDLEETRRAMAETDLRLRDLERERDGARSELARLEALWRERQSQLGRRLRIYREEGRVGLLGVVAGAASLEEFMTRLDLVRWLLARDSRLIGETRALQVAVEARAQQLHAAETGLREGRDRLAADEQKLQAAIGQREALLASLRERRAAVEAQLNDLERVWAEKARPVLEALGSVLQTVDPAEFQPDRINVSLFPPGATAVVTGDGLGRFFGRKAELKGLTFRVKPGSVSLEGEFEGAAVRVAGQFGVAGKTLLRFEPREVQIRDFAVPMSALEQLPGRGRVEIDVSEMIRPWSLQDVTMAEGELRIRAGLK